jgi:hypothetical protein
LNLLDENFPADQRLSLREWRIPHRQLGVEVSYLGIKDDNIIPLLHRFGRVTFFTRDEDFFKRHFCHAAYCIVWLDVKEDDAAVYVRRFLRHALFVTQRKRMGLVARVRQEAIHFWAPNQLRLQRAGWD